LIQLATDPNASRLNWRPAAAANAEEHGPVAQKARSGHAWPFISRHTERPAAAQPAPRTPTSQGS
jgi:hypothetical protein